MSTSQKPHGFLELFSGQDPIVDIVALHGLDGHREHSWTADDGTMWLKDLLPDDIPKARILTYGYDADTRSFSRTSTQTIFHHAEAFAEDLSRLRRATDPKRPIIFLAHSLGGIILKKALVLCHGDDFEITGNLRDILVSTFAILFFGTPHSGANGVQLAEWMGRVLSVCMSTNDRILKALNRDSPELENIQRLYLPASKRIKTIFFYEEYPTPIVTGMTELIVPRPLAIVQGDSKARVVVLHADHCQMVKYTKKNDVNYKKVIDYLSGLVNEAPVAIEQNWIRENAHRGIENGEITPSSRPTLPKAGIPVSRSYVHRQDIYDFITEKLLPSTPSEHQPRCILHGLGGGGKTQAASFWIGNHKDKFNRVIVVDASTKQQIEADLETVIRSIGSQYNKATWADTVTYLSNEKGWLLFLDNADDPDLSLDEYLPNSKHGVVLITTRNRECIVYAPDSHIQVGKMSESEAVHLLHKVANITPPSNDVSLAITRELGMWALAITQAGAYIFKTRRLDSYLDMFQKHRNKLMREALRLGRNYQGSTYAAFDLSFGLLPRNAQDLMKICAFLHYSLIPRALFERSAASGFRTYTEFASFPPPTSDERDISALEEIFGSEWDDLTFQTLIESISRGSLMDTLIDDNGECFYNIHPLVQTYILDLLEREDWKRHASLAGQLLLGAIRPLLEDKNNSWHRQLSPHVDNLRMEIKLSHASHTLAFLMVYESIGNWNGSQVLMEYCWSEFKSTLGARHPDTITTMYNLAWILLSCGRLEEAERMQREVLALQNEILGQHHPNTIAAMHDLASTLKSRGQLEEAERMQREVLALWNEILGQHHPHTIASMHSLASTLKSRGQLEEAEIMQREVLALRNEILGQRHPDTITSMHDLASTLKSRGQLEEAERMQREVLALRNEILGQRHPDTITSMHNLALTLEFQGQLEEAERMQREVLALRNEILGRRHPDTITSMGNLAWTLLSH
ncbi:hypothetical protein FRB91_003453, partial [Serendipita sp. 411]